MPFVSWSHRQVFCFDLFTLKGKSHITRNVDQDYCSALKLVAASRQTVLLSVMPERNWRAGNCEGWGTEEVSKPSLYSKTMTLPFATSSHSLHGLFAAHVSLLHPISTSKYSARTIGKPRNIIRKPEQYEIERDPIPSSQEGHHRLTKSSLQTLPINPSSRIVVRSAWDTGYKLTVSPILLVIPKKTANWRICQQNLMKHSLD